MAKTDSLINRKKLVLRLRTLFLYKCSWKSKFKVNSVYVLIIVWRRRAKTIAKGLEHHAGEKLLFTQITYCLRYEFGKWLCGLLAMCLKFIVKCHFNTFRWCQGLFHMLLICRKYLLEIKVNCYEGASSSRSRNSTRKEWLEQTCNSLSKYLAYSNRYWSSKQHWLALDQVLFRLTIIY